jgi:hypothetical protein
MKEHNNHTTNSILCALTVHLGNFQFSPPILIHIFELYLLTSPLKVGTNENGSACGRWLSIGI